MLRHATVLRNKLKDHKYDFLSQTFGYPSKTSLNRISNSSWKYPDGLCHKILERKRWELEKNNKDLERIDFRRT